MSAFGDCVVQCRELLDRHFGTKPKIIHLRVLGASFLFLGCLLLSGRANTQWAIGYAGACFSWVVAPERKDLDRTYGERFVGRIRASLILTALLAILAFVVFIVALSAKVALSPAEHPGLRIFCGLIVAAGAVGATGLARSLRRPTKAQKPCTNLRLRPQMLDAYAPGADSFTHGPYPGRIRNFGKRSESGSG